MRPKVYLAGPAVFRKYSLDLGESMKALCEKHGLEGIFPMDPDLDPLEPGNPESGLKIYLSDVELVTYADAVIADMTPFRGPSMDTGTAFEMGLAVGQGKPVFGYTTDQRLYEQKLDGGGFQLKWDDEGILRDQNGDSVESFGMVDNLMMVGAAMLHKPERYKIYPSFEEAVIAATRYFLHGRWEV